MHHFNSHRLTLRNWRCDDLADLHQLMSNQKIARMAGFRVREYLAETKDVLNIFISEEDDSIWAIECKQSNKVIGWIELHSLTASEVCLQTKEIGIVLHENYWGRGLAYEVMQVIIDFAFTTQHLKMLVCSHFDYNEQSKKVIEKCGFHYIDQFGEQHYYNLKNPLL